MAAPLVPPSESPLKNMLAARASAAHALRQSAEANAVALEQSTARIAERQELVTTLRTRQRAVGDFMAEAREAQLDTPMQAAVVASLGRFETAVRSSGVTAPEEKALLALLAAEKADLIQTVGAMWVAFSKSALAQLDPKPLTLPPVDLELHARLKVAAAASAAAAAEADPPADDAAAGSGALASVRKRVRAKTDPQSHSAASYLTTGDILREEDPQSGYAAIDTLQLLLEIGEIGEQRVSHSPLCRLPLPGTLTAARRAPMSLCVPPGQIHHAPRNRAPRPLTPTARTHGLVVTSLQARRRRRCRHARPPLRL